MLRNRVIPVLLLDGSGLVKTIRFSDPIYVGDPVNAVKIFNEKEVDEIVLLDIGVGDSGRGPNFDLISDVASECFMPLAYGGGIRGVDDARKLFSLGVEKVVLRRVAAQNESVVSEIVGWAGASSVAISVDVRTPKFGKPHLYNPGTRLHKSPHVVQFVEKMISCGAGEIFLNAVDRDGTRTGMDLRLIREIADVVSVPLVAIGGVGSVDDIVAGIEAGADAVGAGSFFIFHGPRRAVLLTYPRYEELVGRLGNK